jgi:hypothetical protein
MSRTIAIIIGAALIGTVAYFVSSRLASTASRVEHQPVTTSEDDTSPVERRMDEIVRLESEVALLRGEVAYLRRSMAKAAEAQGVTPERHESWCVLKADSDEGSWRTHMEGVHGDFEREPKDARWSIEIESFLRGVVHQNGAIEQGLRRLECRSQTCRVEMRADGRVAEQVQSLLQRTRDMLPAMQSEEIQENNGETTLVLYLTTS